MGKFQSKHGEVRPGGWAGRGRTAPLTVLPSPSRPGRAAAAAACKRRESPEGERGDHLEPRSPEPGARPASRPGRGRWPPGLGSGPTLFRGWAAAPALRGPWGLGRERWRLRRESASPGLTASPSSSVGAAFPARPFVTRRGQLRGVRRRERPQRHGGGGAAPRRRRGAPRAGQAGRLWLAGWDSTTPPPRRAARSGAGAVHSCPGPGSEGVAQTADQSNVQRERTSCS